MAANGAPGTPDLPDAVNRPPPGVVLPPKDIRLIIERTAGFVERNGRAFEDRIREKNTSNPKFSFLSDNDAYNPFYIWRLKEIKEGRGTDLSAGRPGAAAAPVAEVPKGPEPPPDFHFSARMPNISAQDLDVVKLTALFVAKNGRGWMTTLSQREARNYQFDFLRPQHSLHQFFSRLVDQYTDLLQAQTVDNGRVHQARMRELEENVQNRLHVLDKAKKRAEWVKYQERQKVEKEEEKEKEQLEYAQIDWHDFVVVETVVFTDADDQAELPPPTSLNDLMNASLEQKAAMSLAPHSMRIEEAFPTEDMYAYLNPQQQPPPQFPPQPPASASPYNGNNFAPPPPSQPYYPAGPTPPAPGLPPPPAFAPKIDEDEARAIAERTAQREQAAAAQAAARGQSGAPMRIRSDYVPRAQAKRQQVATTLCPNCKQQIPLSEYDEHIRIELLNPQWKEQRERGQARLASSHVPIMDASKNIARAAAMVPQKREGDGQGAADGDDKRRKLDRPGPPAALSVEDQLQQIKQKFGSS